MSCFESCKATMSDGAAASPLPIEGVSMLIQLPLLDHGIGFEASKAEQVETEHKVIRHGAGPCQVLNLVGQRDFSSRMLHGGNYTLLPNQAAIPP